MKDTRASDPRALSKKDLVLATDLDGTFLGGSERERGMFYRWIETNRHRVGLIFVTGRDPGFIRALARGGDVPRPDYVVGDVGTTIARFSSSDTVDPITTLEAEIAEAWGNRGDRVQAALHGMPGLRLQSNAFRYRASYDMDPARFSRRAVDVVEEMGLDALVSDNRFFDVLPKGVSKGPSLRRLLDYLGIMPRRVLVAGDTLNDLSMFELGLPSVAVANSEPALLSEIARLDHVHTARAAGAAGIAEAILEFEFLSQSAA